MPDNRIEGVEVGRTEHKKIEKKYTESDVEVVLRRGRWQSWGEMIHWLETEGEKDNELTAGETIALVEDLRQVQSSGEQFTNDPHRVYQLMRQHHGVQAEEAPRHEVEARGEEERRREAEHRREEERRREAETRSEEERRHEAERREEVQPEEAPAGERGLYSEKGILRRGGYIWR